MHLSRASFFLLRPKGGEEPATGLVPVVDCGVAARRMGALLARREGPHPSRAEDGARHLPHTFRVEKDKEPDDVGQSSQLCLAFFIGILRGG